MVWGYLKHKFQFESSSGMDVYNSFLKKPDSEKKIKILKKLM